jgi:D-amino-acid oxidase
MSLSLPKTGQHGQKSKDSHLRLPALCGSTRLPSVVSTLTQSPCTTPSAGAWLPTMLGNALASEQNIGKAAGVSMKPGDFFLPCQIEEDADQLSKMEEISASGVIGFRRDPELVRTRRVDPRYGCVDAYEFLSPIIDTDVSMAWLSDLVRAKGAKFVTETIEDDLLVLGQELYQRFSADAIVNCTGLAATHLAGDDTCYPIRGALIRVINDGTDFPKVENALTITAGAIHDSDEINFVVPRNDNILLLGVKLTTTP